MVEFKSYRFYLSTLQSSDNLSPYLYVPHHRKMFCFGHILQMVCIRLSRGSRDAASSFDTADTKYLWSHLWKLKILNKVKSSLWRVFTNSIPTMQNLLN